MKKLFAVILCLSISAFFFAACGGGESEPVDNSGRTDVIVAMSKASEPAAGFDPCNNWGAGDHVHEPLLQSTLLVTDVDLNFQNDLATEYSVSEDGLTWTFTIRDDVKFTDGEPLTAADVAFTYNTTKNNPASATDLTMLESAEAIDDSTVVFHMARPFNAFLYTVAVLGIVPEHAYNENYGQNPIGSGRYMLEQWDMGQQAIFVANPDYYGEKPLMERVVILFMDEDAAFAAAKSGQLDITYTAASYSEQSIEGMQLLAFDSVDSRGLSLPVVEAGGTLESGEAVGNDVTADLAIRRAINLAIDRETMAANTLYGYGTPAYSVSDNMPWYSTDMAVECDREAAKALLEEAGWVAGSDGIYAKDGLRASFNCLYPASDSVRQALAAELANQLKEVGIEMTYEGLSWDDIYVRSYAEPVLWGWGANSPVEIYNIYYSSGNANAASYVNETVDENIDRALAAATMDASYGSWQAAQWDGSTGFAPQGDAPWVWLVNIQHLYFANSDLVVAEQKLHPHGHGWSLVNNVDRWSWQ